MKNIKKMIVLVMMTGIITSGTVLAACAKEWDWTKAAEPYKGTMISVRINYHPAILAQLPWAVKEFEKKTGIGVQFSMMTRRNLIGKQEIELAAGSSTYDIIYISTDVAARYRRAGWAEALEPYVENPQLTDPDFDLEDFVQTYLDAVSPPLGKGPLLGLPFSGESSIMFYRKDIFKEYGIAQFPDTMEEFENVAAKINTKEIPAFGARAQRGQGINMYIWSGWLWSYGGKFFDEEMKPVINSPEAVRAAEEYASLLQRFGPEGIANMNHHDLVPMFAQGYLAMFPDATVWVTVFNDPERSNVIGKWAAAQIPKGPAGRFTAIGPQEMAINAFSKNKEAAWLFLQWFTSKEIQLRRATEVPGKAGDVTRLSVMQHPEYRKIWDAGTNWIAATAKAASIAKLDYRPTHLPEWVEIGDTIGIAIQDVIARKTKAKPALDEANKRIYEIMKRAGYYE